MRVLKLLGVGGVVAVAVFIAVGLVLPNRWQLEREVTIAAPVELVQARVAHLKLWPEWSRTSPSADAQATFSWEGQDGAPGSTMRWSGPKLGRGALTVREVVDGAKVVLDGAIESDHVNARSTFTFTHDAGKTRVRWQDEGATPPIVGGYMRGFLEEALGAHIEASLAALRERSEEAARSPPPPAASAPAPAPTVAAELGTDIGTAGGAP